MKFSIKPLLVLIVLFWGTNTLLANGTNDEVFEKALKAYDEVVDINKKIYGKEKGSKNENADKGKTVTKEEYPDYKKKMDNAMELFDQYLRIGKDATKKKVANLYLLNLKKMDISASNELQQFSSSYRKIADIERLLTTVKGYYLPISYASKGKKYRIKKKTLTDIERTLYVQFTKASSFSYKYSDAAKWGKKAYGYYSLGDYNLWWSAHMWFYNNSKAGKNDADMVEASEKLIYSVSGLKKSDIKMLTDSNYANHTHAYKKLNYLLRQKPELSKNGEVWANTGSSFDKIDKDVWAMEYYQKALDAGYGDKTFLLKMMSLGKDKSNKELVNTAVKIYDSKNLYSTYYSCEDYNTIADYFEYAGNATKANELRDKYKSCNKELKKQQRRAARGGKFYVSFAPLAPISKNLQGSVQIGGNRRLHEFGVKQTQSQRDFGVDEDFRWSGLGFYYTYKKFYSNSSGANFYVGFQLRYTEREYEDITSRVKDKTTNTSRNLTFSPSGQRYDFTIQAGSIFASRFFHVEYYTGIGLGYTTLTDQRSEWNNNNFEFDQEDLAARQEPKIGLTLRLGFMIGLNFINK